VGGLVATGAFGPRRARYGSARDLIIGISFLRADGVRVRGGGKVVKNVAGFDLPKLLTGSHGSLGLIATVTLRLHPLPEAMATVSFAGLDGAAVRQVVAAARDAQLEPAALAVVVPAGEEAAELGVRFEGFEAAVHDQARRLLDAATRLGLPARALDAAGAEAFWARHEAARAAAAELRVKVALRPADPGAADLLARLRRPLRAARSVFYPTLGLGFVSGDVERAETAAAAVAEARATLAPTGGTVVVHAAPLAVRARLDVWGTTAALRSALPLMRALKQRLDPDRRLAPGRFVGGI
jgi:glycolate oxidase FAD binding subunit